MDKQQIRVYEALDEYIETNWPLTVPQFYDAIESVEESLPARSFKEVAQNLADKWFPDYGIEIYHSLKQFWAIPNKLGDGQ